MFSPISLDYAVAGAFGPAIDPENFHGSADRSGLSHRFHFRFVDFVIAVNVLHVIVFVQYVE